MTTLAAVLVHHKAELLDAVEQAMLRQSFYGGDLATNLLEMGALDEATLLGLLAKALELEPVESGPLPSSDTSLRASVPHEAVTSNGTYPLSVSSRGVELAVSTRLPQTVLEELTMALGKPIVQRAALEVRIRQALAHDYQEPLEDRLRALIDQLDGVKRATLASSADQPGPEKGGDSPPAAAPSSVNTVSPQTAAGIAAARLSVPPRRPPRRLGPFTAAMAEAELLEATTPDDVSRIWLDFSAQFFEYSAVFAVQGDLAAGRHARGSGAQDAELSVIGVPLDLPGVLRSGYRARHWQLAPLTRNGLDASLAKDLGRPTGQSVLVVPVILRERPVLLLYGDHGEQDVDLAAVGDVLAFTPLVERALERVLLERKRPGSTIASLTPKLRPTAKAEARRPAPEVERRAQALARVVIRRGSQIPPAVSPTDAPATSWSSDVEPPPAAPTQAATLDGPEPRAASGLPTPSHHHQPTIVEPSSEQRIPTPVVDGAASVHPIVEVATEPPLSDVQGLGREPLLAVQRLREIDVVRGAPTDTPDGDWTAPVQRPSGPPLFAEIGTKPGLAPRLELVPELDARPRRSTPLGMMLPHVEQSEAIPEPATPTAPSPAPEPANAWQKAAEGPADAHPAPFPVGSSEPARHEQEMLQVVNQDELCGTLVERLLTGDMSAIDELIPLGDTAASYLVRELPGPIVTPSRHPRGEGQPHASDCGPILRALVAMGPVARPYVIARTADVDPGIRAWTTRLLAELPGRQSAVAVARRLVQDRDPEVRRAAFYAGQQLSRDPDTRGALRADLLATAGTRTNVVTQRLAAIDALCDLRDVESIPDLVTLLSDTNPGTAASAQQALSVLTRQDFGFDAMAWIEWWKSHRGQHRVEWLIDALEHPSSTIRQAAAEELRAMSRIYVGDYDDGSMAGRARIRQRYLDWWMTTGQMTFSPPGRT